MVNITTAQARQRFPVLPSVIQDAIFSENTAEIISRTGEQNHLSDEKISRLAQCIGWVLLGFIHPEELAKEIQDELGIDGRIAAAIAEPLNRKIFQPLREELEEIYAPAGEVPAPAPSGVEGPRPVMVEEIIKPAVSIPAPSASEIPVVAPAPIPAAPTPQPTAASMPVAPATKAEPVAEPIASPANLQPSPPADGFGGEAQSATPFILHQESEFQPVMSTKVGFEGGLPTEQFGKLEQKWTPPPKAARIETFTPETQMTPAPGIVEGRVVHYGDLKTPVAPTPSKAERPASPLPTPPAAGRSEPPSAQPAPAPQQLRPGRQPAIPGARNMFEELKRKQNQNPASP